MQVLSIFERPRTRPGLIVSLMGIAPTSAHNTGTKFENFWVPEHKVGCVFPMVVVTLLPHAEFGQNYH